MFVSDENAEPTPRFQAIKFAVLFLLCLFLADRAVGYALSQLVRTSDYRLSRLYAGTANADVLVTGNSVANAMVIPTNLTKTLGSPVFSIASHGMDSFTQQAFLEDYLDNQPAPKVVVMEIRPVLSPMRTAPAFSTFQSLSQRMRTQVRETEPSIATWSTIFHTFRVNSPQLPNILIKIVDRDDQRTGPSNGKINASLIHQWQIRPNAPEVAPAQLRVFAESVRKLQGAGSKVIVIAAPLHPAARKDGAWITKAEREVRAALPGDVPLFDFSAALSEDQYFEDPIHLNRTGRAALEPLLLKVIREASERTDDKSSSQQK